MKKSPVIFLAPNSDNFLLYFAPSYSHPTAPWVQSAGIFFLAPQCCVVSNCNHGHVVIDIETIVSGAPSVFLIL